MSLDMMIICPVCDGEKYDYLEIVEEPCPMCEGHGELTDIPCPSCEGRGCPACFGSGVVEFMQCPQCDGMGGLEVHPKCSNCRATGWVPNPIFEQT